MTTLPQFIEAGMNFFKTKAADSAAPPAPPMDPIGPEVVQLLADVDALKLEVEQLKAEVAKLKADLGLSASALASLEGNFVSAGRQTAQALASVAVAPVAVSATPSNAVKGFVELVHERIESGKTKAESIGFCIKNHPAEYLLARQNGGLGKI